MESEVCTVRERQYGAVNIKSQLYHRTVRAKEGPTSSECAFVRGIARNEKKTSYEKQKKAESGPNGLIPSTGFFLFYLEFFSFVVALSLAL